MGVIGNIAVILRAPSRQFVRDIGTARGSLAKFRAGALVAVSALRTLGVAAATGAAVGLSVLAKRQLKSIDENQKLADQLGTTIGQIEGLNLAASLSGDPVERVGKALKALAKNIGEASQGLSKQAIPAIEALGLDLKKLNKQSPADTFLDMADAISNFGTDSEKAAFAQRFGLKDFLMTLKVGKKGLMDLRNEVVLYGLDLNRTQTAGVEKFNDSMTRLGASLRGIGNTIALIAAPVDKFIERLSVGLAMLNIFLKKAAGQDISKEKVAFGNKFGLTAQDANRSSLPLLGGVLESASPIAKFNKGLIVSGLKHSPVGIMAEIHATLLRIAAHQIQPQPGVVQ